MKRNWEERAQIRRRHWILKTVEVLPPPWRASIKGRVSGETDDCGGVVPLVVCVVAIVKTLRWVFWLAYLG